MALRQDLQQALDDIDAANRAAEALVTGLTDEQFFWQPNEGRSWSIAQCLEHLALGNALYAAAMAGAIEDGRRRDLRGGGPIAPGFLERQFIASLEPPVKRRMRAPTKILPPSGWSRDQIMRSFGEAHERLRGHVHAAADLDVNRVKFRNPFIRILRVRLGSAFRILAAHDRRHIWQAQNVTKTAGFPSSR